MATKKQPTAPQVKAAVAKYLEKHMGEGIGCEERTDPPGGYQLTDARGMTLVIGQDLACILDGSPSPLTEKELRGYILEMAEDAPEAPRTEDKKDRMIMPNPRSNRATSQLAASCDTVLTPEKVRDYFCKTATPEECMFALEVCSIRGLNPFKLDCYLVKYEGKTPKLEILVSNSFLLKRAMGHPDFEYFKAGVTVIKGDLIENVAREYAYPGEELLGGWAEIKRRSISVPFRAEIPLAGNKKESKWWVQTPGHMIRKIASSQVCREAFPDELGGLYDTDEMGLDPSREVAA